MTSLIIGGVLLYGLIVAAALMWLQLQNRLDLLELLMFPRPSHR
jgi:hypothetical protein